MYHDDDDEFWVLMNGLERSDWYDETREKAQEKKNRQTSRLRESKLRDHGSLIDRQQERSAVPAWKVNTIIQIRDRRATQLREPPAGICSFSQPGVYTGRCQRHEKHGQEV